MNTKQIEISNVNSKSIEWHGPFARTGFEKQNGLEKIPDIDGIYLWTFRYKNGFLIYCAGITKSTKKRFRQHTLEYKSGNYTVFDVTEAEKGKRVEIWHGWSYARAHREEFIERKEEILSAVDKQLESYRVFVAQMPNKRERARLEAAIMHYIYNSQEPWAELADRGMSLSKRRKDEEPIIINNICDVVFFGLPNVLEV